MSNPQGRMAVSSAIGSIANTPSVEMRSFQVLGQGRARIVADVHHTSTSRSNHDEVMDVINKKLNAKMRAVAGSFDSLSSTQFVDRISGIVSVNKQSFAATEENMHGFKAVASNMFMDDEKDMWVLRKTEGGDLMIKTTGVEDDMAIAGLLQATCSTQAAGDMGHAYRSLSNYAPPSVVAGDLVTVIDANDQAVLAFVVATVDGSEDLIVQASTQDAAETIKPAAIIEKHDVSQVPDDESTAAENLQASVSAARGVASIAEISAYYKRVFVRRAAYFNEFMKRFRAHKFA